MSRLTTTANRNECDHGRVRVLLPAGSATCLGDPLFNDIWAERSVPPAPVPCVPPVGKAWIPGGQEPRTVTAAEG